MRMKQVFLINQPVIVGDEIGYISKHDAGPFDHWVYLPSRGYASSYADGNVKSYNHACAHIF